jgi:DNA-binding NtrC family response regulator
MFNSGTMGLREDALRRILSLDAGRSAQLSLRLAQDQVQAQSGAVVAIDGERYVLFAAAELDERDLRQVAEAWSHQRTAILAGRPVIGSEWAVVPFGRPVTGMLYVGRARSALTPAILKHVVADLGELLELAISVRAQEPETKLVYETLLQRTPLRAIEKQRLVLLLKAHNWNKTKTALALGTTRATLYKWLERYRIQKQKPA